MNAAVFYHPEAYSTSGPKLMGRNAAGESFLRGLLRHSRASTFWAQVEKTEHAGHFARRVRACGRAEPVKSVDKSSLGALSGAGTVFYPGPGIGDHAYHRAAFGHGAWSLCGITHTTSSAGAMDALAALITAPVHAWDAVICTSNAVKDNVLRLLQAKTDYLGARLGISKVVLPQLPVIPLGIHTEDFNFSADQRNAARASLGAGVDTLVVLFTGRLSFHAKAHPLAMYQSLEAAVRATGKEVILVECGWHANEHIASAYSEAAREVCPSVRVIVLDGRKADNRNTAWAGADVFCSLSDNIQETFGIVPIEAMAAGLPVVVSDWDGYKDTVRHGVDGFRIPTMTPPAGISADLAFRHALELDNYDMYCGLTCSLVAVDVQASTAAFVRLFNSPALRAAMGTEGRRRARALYDWRNIISEYETLWNSLNETRTARARELPRLAHPWPARLDPFHAFAKYPTTALTPETVLSLVDRSPAEAIARTLAYRRLSVVAFARSVAPTDDEIRSVLGAAAQSRTAVELTHSVAPERRPIVFRALVWLLKLGVLRASG